MWPLHTYKFNNKREENNCETFDALIEIVWVKLINVPHVSRKEPEYFEEYMDDTEAPRVIPDK